MAMIVVMLAVAMTLALLIATAFSLVRGAERANLAKLYERLTGFGTH